MVALLWAPSSLASDSTPDEEYVGAEACRSCHQVQHDLWSDSTHGQILRTPDDPTLSDIPVPPGYTTKDLSYVIGGARWKALFITEQGFIITHTKDGPGQNQYNIIDGTWSDYMGGQRVPYDCGVCHTTGYKGASHRNDWPGGPGTWLFNGVQCEACHGPGKKHTVKKDKTSIVLGKDVCRRCHGREPYDEIPMEGVFLSPYTEHNQLIASPHKDMGCIDCHDPHKPLEDRTKAVCLNCHKDVWSSFQGSFKNRVGLTCIDCHMPRAGLVAKGEPERFLGDLRSHLFRIDHHAPPPPSAGSDTLENSPAYLTVDQSCVPCHHLFETRAWATSFGPEVHNLRITLNRKIIRLQTVMTFAGMAAALISLLSGLSLKGVIKNQVNKKHLLTVHQEFAWITFSIFSFISVMCLYFHFPWQDPRKLLHEGLFIVHPFAGAGLFIAYTIKIWIVRRLKEGWKLPGLLAGTVLFLLWTLQFLTVVTK
jgi:hypothetical protein